MHAARQNLQDYEPANIVCPNICNTCPSKARTCSDCPIDCNLHVIYLKELLDDNNISHTYEPAQKECSDDILKKFFWKYKRNSRMPKLKDCNWLSFTTDAKKQDACDQTESYRDYKLA
eukprot:58266_1